MNLGALSIRRGVTTAMAFLALAGFGAFSLWRLPLNRLPEVELPVIVVVTSYTGASPRDMETLVSEPIERAVASVEGVERVSSESRKSVSIVRIEFTWGTKMDAAEVEVRKNIDLFAGEFLPDEADRPITFAFDPSLAPVVFLSVDGPLDAHRLRNVARDEVAPYLGRLDGVAAAEVIGGLERQIQVRLRPRRLQALGISPNEVVDGLRAANVVAPSGAVDDGTQELGIQPTGLFQSIEEIEAVVVAERGGRLVRASEVATVVDSFAEETHVVSVDGRRAVLLAVRKQSDSNTVQTVRNVRRALPGVEERLPAGVSLTPLFDEAEPVERAIGNLGLTGLQAFLLTGLVLLVFLRSVRSSLIAAIAVPVSILVAFTAMDALGVTLNLFSMAGLALAIGMLVDNGIVVLEAAFQRVERGEPVRDAAVSGAREMAMPLLASTLTTVVVFIPILLVEGIAGELFRDLVVTVCATLLCSFLVAVSLVPLMFSRLARPPKERARAQGPPRGFARIVEAYGRGLDRALHARSRVLWGAVLVFAAAIGLGSLLGRDFLPKADVSQVRLEVAAAPGTSLDRMRDHVAAVRQVITEVVPEVELVSADYGAAEGFAALFGGTSNRGTMRVELPPPTDRARSQQAIEDALAARFEDMPGLDVQIRQVSLGGAGGDIRVKLFGSDLDRLRLEGERLREELLQLEGVREASFSMRQGSPELDIRYDRERMQLLGVSPSQVASTVATFFQGETATFYREGGDQFAVRVRAPTELRRRLDHLRYLPLQVPVAGAVPLAAVATIGDQLGPVAIEHEDQERFASLDLTVSGMDLGGAVSKVEARLADVDLPEGVRFEIGGAAEDLRDAFFKLGLALIAALLLVYMVLASQFESLLEPFVIMFTVPLSAVGIVLALLLTGTTLQVTALVGVILLGGIVVNNGIVLIDVLKRRHAEGMSLHEAALEAGRSRLRPILMTALTTILGMVPLSLGYGDGAETWAPMARAVIGGMIASTALTLFVIPVLYVSLASRRRAANATTRG